MAGPTGTEAATHRPGRVRRPRNVLSVVALLLALCLLVVVVVLGWASRTALDRDEVAKRTVHLLESSAVRSELANELADQLIAVEPRLVSYRSVLVIAVESVVQTDGFKEVFKRAVAKTHDAVFRGGEDSAILDLADSLGVIVGTLRVTAPDVADQLPDDIDELAVEITDRVQAIDLGQVAHDVRHLAQEAFVVAAVLIAVSIALATNRRRSIIAVGFGLVAVALVVLLGLQVAPRLATNGIADPGLRGAIRSGIDLFTEDLRTQMRWLALLGLLVAAVANASAARGRRIELARVRSWGERWAGAVPATSWGRVLRGVVLVAAGALVLTNGQLVLTLVVVVIGAWIVYVGLTEVILVVGQQPVPEPVEGGKPEVAPRGPGGLRAWRIAGVTAVLLALIGVGALVTTQAASTAASEAGERQCNGHAELCDRRLDEVVFAATHNSMSSAEQPNWLFGEHFGDIPAQLEYGIRAFLIDTHYGVPSTINLPGTSEPLVLTDASREIEPSEPTDAPTPEQLEQLDAVTRGEPVGASGVAPDVYLCHNYCELGATRFSDALAAYKQFLDHNPNEVIILFVEDYVTTADTEEVFRESGLIDHVWTVQPDQPLPTLGEMIDEGRQVLVLSEHFGPPPDWYHAGFELAEETPYTFEAIEDFSCDPNRGGTDRSLFLLNHWLTHGAPDIEETTRANGRDVLMDRIRACEEERGRKVNLVAVNFYDRGELLDIVDELNGVSR